MASDRGWANLPLRWQSGKPLLGTSVRHCRTQTCCLLCQLVRLAKPRAEAQMAATRKSSKYTHYADLSHSHHFQPIALETLGSMNSSCRSVISFFQDLGRRISIQPGLGGFMDGMHPISSSVLQLPTSTQRFNSVLFQDSLPMSPRTIQMPIATPAFDFNYLSF